jgi:hypothetical protein
MSVWPPLVLSGAGTTFVRSGDGVLKRVAPRAHLGEPITAIGYLDVR